jgi:hypothetical protein
LRTTFTLKKTICQKLRSEGIASLFRYSVEIARAGVIPWHGFRHRIRLGFQGLRVAAVADNPQECCANDFNVRVTFPAARSHGNLPAIQHF